MGDAAVLVTSQELSDTIPDEKAVIIYAAHLFHRLPLYRLQENAAFCIQRFWRRTLKSQRGVCHIERVSVIRSANMETFDDHNEEESDEDTFHSLNASIAAEETEDVGSIEVQARIDKALLLQEQEDARLSALEEARLRAEEEARVLAEAKAQAEAEALREAQRRAEELAAAELDRQLQLQKKEREELLRNNAATCIQRVIRGWHVRSTFFHLVHASIILQRAYRLHLQRKCARLEAGKLRQRMIQEKLRCQQQQQEIEAAIIFQAAARRFLAMRFTRRMRHRRLRRLSAALILQSTFRALRQRRIYMQMRDAYRAQQQHACVVIQSAWRGYIQRSLFVAQREQTRTLAAKRHHAALIIQTYARGALARLHFTHLWEAHIQRQEEAAATAIQTMVRAYQARCILQQKRVEHARRLHLQTQAAVFLQAQCRGFLQRRVFVKLLAARRACENQAAIVLQTAFRGLIQRRKYVIMRNSWRAKQAAQWIAAIKLQSWSRMWLARRRFCVALAQHREHVRCCQLAAVRIQAYFRGYIQRARFSVVLDQHRRCIAAATILQAALRGFIQRRNFAHLQRQCREKYEIQVRAATTIQTFCRSFLARILARQLHHKLCLRIQAATKIQALHRGWCARRRIQQMHRAALCIQNSLRMYWARVLFYQHQQSAIKLQTAVRGFLARRKLGCLRQEALSRTVAGMARIHAVRCLQTAFRQYRARRLEKLHNEAAIMIQKHVRGYLTQKYYASLHAASLRLQGWWRRVRGQLHLIRMRRSAVRIQAWYRGCVTRKATSDDVKRQRQRIAEATSKAQDHMRIGNRGHSALEILLTHKQLSYVLRACEDLDTVTRLSTTYCEKMRDQNAIPIIFQLIRSCNRSQPHMAVLMHAVRIVLHLARYRPSAGAVFSQPDCSTVMVEQMQMFRDRPEIFEPCCTTLMIMMKDADRREQFKRCIGLFDRVKSIASLLEVIIFPCLNA